MDTSIRPLSLVPSQALIRLKAGSSAQTKVVYPGYSAVDRLDIQNQPIDGPSGDLFISHEAWLQELSKVQHEAPSISQLPDFSITPLRVAVALAQKQASFSVQQATLSVLTSQGEILLGDFKNTHFQVQALPTGFRLSTAKGQELGSFEGSLHVRSATGQISINGSRYRGDLEIRPHPTLPGSLNLINNVLLEDYLLSVVPSESPASWPLESLKAQAMAARTYAVANWRKHEALGFDLTADTSDQVYTGIQGEQPASSQAVRETHQQIIAWQGKPITALFFSSSGGMTDSALEVWGVDLPYIQPVQDFDQASPRYRWNKVMTQEQLQHALKKLGLNLGALHKIEVLEKTSQGRVKRMRLTGTQGSAEVDANRFRFAAGLFSTHWEVHPSSGSLPREFVFQGRGWGHGLGMSQWGARQMAEDGRRAEEIIQHYYQGVNIVSLQTHSDNMTKN